MGDVLQFIKDFKFSTYGLDGWDLLLIFGIAMFLIWVIEKIIAKAPSSEAHRLKRRLSFVVRTIIYLILALVTIHAVLIHDYVLVFAGIFGAFLPNLRTWVGSFYKRYDDIVDKITKP